MMSSNIDRSLFPYFTKERKSQEQKKMIKLQEIEKKKQDAILKLIKQRNLPHGADVYDLVNQVTDLFLHSNPANAEIVGKNKLPPEYFKKMLLVAIDEMLSVLIAEDKPADKISKYLEDFFDCFQKYQSQKLPEVLTPGLVLGDVLNKMIIWGTNEEITRDILDSNVNEYLSGIAQKENKSYSDFCRIYAKYFESILKIFAEFASELKRRKAERNLFNKMFKEYPRNGRDEILRFIWIMQELFREKNVNLNVLSEEDLFPENEEVSLWQKIFGKKMRPYGD